MKEFIAAGLVYQRHQLFKLTEEGIDLADYLQYDKDLKRWVANSIKKCLEERLIRPKISQLENHFLM